MNLHLIYQPGRLIERLALEIKKKRKLKKLSNTVAANLKYSHIDSLELLEIIKNDLSLSNKPVVYDIGSNIGTWTLLAKALIPSATVHAFEPLPDHISQFKKNCAQLSNVYLHEFCVGNENTNGIINISSFSDSSSLLAATPLEFEHFNISKKQEKSVEIKKIAGLVNNKTIPAADIIKLDIQGFELEALKGMGEGLDNVKYIICEVSFKEYYYGQPMFLEIANYLRDHNLQIFAFGSNTPIGLELNQIDVLFKHV